MVKEFRLIIAGGREFDDYPTLESQCDYLLSKKVADGYTIIIVSGKARGADSLGEKYARARGYTVADFPADWSLGKSAGYKRNTDMANFASNNLVEGGCICFWDNISRGTQHMINICKSKSLPYRIVNY